MLHDVISLESRFCRLLASYVLANSPLQGIMSLLTMEPSTVSGVLPSQSCPLATHCPHRARLVTSLLSSTTTRRGLCKTSVFSTVHRSTQPSMKRQSVHAPDLGDTVDLDSEAIPLSDLRALLEQALKALKYDEEETDIIVEVIAAARHLYQKFLKLRGHCGGDMRHWMF